MSKVVHRHEVLKAAEIAFDERMRRLENQVRTLESEIAYLKTFINATEATEIPCYREPITTGTPLLQHIVTTSDTVIEEGQE